MNNKMTIAELENEYAKLNKQRDALGKVLNERKKEEEDKKKAELAVSKDKRHKEVETAINNAIELLKKYNEDYGSYSITDNINDISFLFGSKPWRWFL